MVSTRKHAAPIGNHRRIETDVMVNFFPNLVQISDIRLKFKVLPDLYPVQPNFAVSLFSSLRGVLSFIFFGLW
jgi:hypothetical protein